MQIAESAVIFDQSRGARGVSDGTNHKQRTAPETMATAARRSFSNRASCDNTAGSGSLDKFSIIRSTKSAETVDAMCERGLNTWRSGQF
jgi:hypothetical protein